MLVFKKHAFFSSAWKGSWTNSRGNCSLAKTQPDESWVGVIVYSRTLHPRMGSAKSGLTAADPPTHPSISLHIDPARRNCSSVRGLPEAQHQPHLGLCKGPVRLLICVKKNQWHHKQSSEIVIKLKYRVGLDVLVKYEGSISQYYKFV